MSQMRTRNFNPKSERRRSQMHPLFKRHPKFLGFVNFISKWVLLAEGLVGIVDIAQNWREIAASPLGFLTAFNHKDGLITNHIASIAVVSAVALIFFFQGGILKYDNAFRKACWIGLIIAVHENLWWITHLFFLRGQSAGAYMFYGFLNYPMFMLVLYILAFGWGKRETVLLAAMIVFYIGWGLMGFHITSDVTGNTIWVNSIMTNVTESLSWAYVCAVGVVTYLLRRPKT